jgi:hypothetical protein
MLGKLKALFTRRAETYNKTATERHEEDELRAGPQGEQEVSVEHEADRYFDAEEGRPREE